jgi:hypothetical protein
MMVGVKATDQPQRTAPRQAELAEASGQLVAMSFPGARRVAGWLFWVVFPLLCVAAIAQAALNISHHIGKKPDGVLGTFVVAPRSCNNGICSFGGEFTSDDGTIKNLPLLGDPRWQAQDVHRVTWNRDQVDVTALPAHWDPTASVVAVVGAVTYLGLAGYLVQGARRDKRD